MLDQIKYCPVANTTHCKCLFVREPVSALQVDMKSALRKLWTDHAVMTARVMNSIVDGDADIEELSERLMQNQREIGDQLAPSLRVGREKADRLTLLLSEHISLAAQVITAATQGSASLNGLIASLKVNAGQVAEAISAINPIALPLQDVRPMFEIHNQFVIDMTKARLAENYKEEIRLYDAYYNEILLLSDAIYASL